MAGYIIRWKHERMLRSALLTCVGFILGVGFSLSLLGLDQCTPSGDVLSAVPGNTPALKLAILVLTAVEYTDRRAAVRASWLSHHHSQVRHWFVLGAQKLSREARTAVLQEQRQHGDLLLLDDAVDQYDRLTDKVLAAFKWLAVNAPAQYVLKCDDDSFVRVPQLLQLLDSSDWRSERLYAGFFDGRARPMKSGPWRQVGWDICDYYLPYALGGGYVISGDLVQYLANNEPLLRRFNSEDVSMGVWLASLQVRRIHEPRFDTEFRSRGCDNRYIVTHKQTPQMMLDKQRWLETNGQLCVRESRSRGSYIYNWTAPPSKCCSRVTDGSIA